MVLGAYIDIIVLVEMREQFVSKTTNSITNLISICSDVSRLLTTL